MVRGVIESHTLNVLSINKDIIRVKNKYIVEKDRSI